MSVPQVCNNTESMLKNSIGLRDQDFGAGYLINSFDNEGEGKGMMLSDKRGFRPDFSLRI